MRESKRLNVGSGLLPLPGYCNIDIKDSEPNYGVDLVADLRELPRHFAPESVEEIFAKDSLEHISWRQVKPTLVGWVSLLKPGGLLKLRVPDTEQIMEEYFNHRHDPDAPQRFSRTIQLLFGDQDFPENGHLAGFKKEYLVEELVSLGLSLPVEPWYDGGRDLRITAVKGSVKPLVSLDHPDYEYKSLGYAQHRAMYYANS